MKKIPKQFGLPPDIFYIGAAFAQACRENDKEIAKLSKADQKKIKREARQSLASKMKALSLEAPWMDVLEK